MLADEKKGRGFLPAPFGFRALGLSTDYGQLKMSHPLLCAAPQICPLPAGPGGWKPGMFRSWQPGARFDTPLLNASTSSMH